MVKFFQKFTPHTYLLRSWKLLKLKSDAFCTEVRFIVRKYNYENTTVVEQFHPSTVSIEYNKP